MTSRLFLLASFTLALTTVAACDDSPPPGRFVEADLIGRYIHDGDCNGSPENPGCDSSMELEADGVGTYVGDDIIEDITWTLDGEVVEVATEGREMTFEVVDDTTLRSPSGALWEKQPPR